MERELTEQEDHMNLKTHQGLPSSEETNPTSSFPQPPPHPTSPWRAPSGNIFLTKRKESIKILSSKPPGSLF